MGLPGCSNTRKQPAPVGTNTKNPCARSQRQKAQARRRVQRGKFEQGRSQATNLCTTIEPRSAAIGRWCAESFQPYEITRTDRPMLSTLSSIEAYHVFSDSLLDSRDEIPTPYTSC